MDMTGQGRTDMQTEDEDGGEWMGTRRKTGDRMTNDRCLVREDRGQELN